MKLDVGDDGGAISGRRKELHALELKSESGRPSQGLRQYTGGFGGAEERVSGDSSRGRGSRTGSEVGGWRGLKCQL